MKKYNALLLAGLVASATCSYGQTINWGTSITPTKTPIIYNSDGEAVFEEITWELGYFHEEFEPTQFNFDAWTKHWKAIQSEKGSKKAFQGDKDNKDTYFRAGGTTVIKDKELHGKQLYLFAYNDTKSIGTPEGEALLLTKSNWKVPSHMLDILNVNIADGPPEDDDEVTVIWGSVDTKVAESDGTSEGLGYIPTPIEETNGNKFEAQTASWKPSSIYAEVKEDKVVPTTINTTPTD